MTEQEKYNRCLAAAFAFFRETHQKDALDILSKATKIEFEDVSFANELDPTYDKLLFRVFLNEAEYWRLKDDLKLQTLIYQTLTDCIGRGYNILVVPRIDLSDSSAP